MSKHILAIRFSALGDVLMTVPVIEAVARKYPDLHITVVSRPAFAGIFGRLPSNVSFHAVKLDMYPGLRGLVRLKRELSAIGADAVCDLHYVLRTMVLDFLFRLSGVRVRHIIKDRKARKEFVEQRPLTQQKTSFARYADAFAALGYPVELNPVQTRVTGGSGVGIAPFAAHQGKIWPLEKMEELVRRVAVKEQVYLFGAGEREIRILEEWERRYDNVHSIAGKLGGLAAELDFISGLRVMVSMDSGNMHLASLAGVRAVSIWGATHPLGGFMGWGQRPEDAIGLNLECRPCSIYGAKPCARGDYACLNGITVDSVLDAIG